MNASIAALLGYVAWTLALLMLLGLLRTKLTLAGERQPNSFDPGGADVSPFSNRRGLLLLAIATGNTAVLVRFAFFGVQLGIAIAWILQFSKL